MTFQVWKRKKGYGPGHAHIYVAFKKDKMATIHPQRSEIQCFTMDRDPFPMKPKDLRERYEPESP